MKVNQMGMWCDSLTLLCHAHVTVLCSYLMWQNHTPVLCDIVTPLVMWQCHIPFSCDIVVLICHVTESHSCVMWQCHIPFSCDIVVTVLCSCVTSCDRITLLWHMLPFASCLISVESFYYIYTLYTTLHLSPNQYMLTKNTEKRYLKFFMSCISVVLTQLYVSSLSRNLSTMQERKWQKHPRSTLSIWLAGAVFC